MNIVILDNFDSFTFNLLDEFASSDRQIRIYRNNMRACEVERRLMSLKPPRLLVLSPGPGHPDDAGSMSEVIKRLKGQVPIFGVCLGMQAIVRAFDGQVSCVKEVIHGKARMLEHDGSLIFKGLKNRIGVGRYHSLSATQISTDLRAFAHSEGLIMAVTHKEYPIIGIQFHPESILTTDGSAMMRNVVAWAKEHA